MDTLEVEQVWRVGDRVFTRLEAANAYASEFDLWVDLEKRLGRVFSVDIAFIRSVLGDFAVKHSLTRRTDTAPDVALAADISDMIIRVVTEKTDADAALARDVARVLFTRFNITPLVK